MPSDPLPERLRDQFSYRSERADIWRGFESFLDTEQFLNLGYSKWYQPHFLGSSQQRLVAKIGDDVAHRLPRTEDVRLLDVGCGRGGPAVHLSKRYGFNVFGIDFVPYNIATARDNSAQNGVSTAFVVADAMELPFRDDSFTVCVALDSIVYMPEKPIVFTEISRVIRDDGLLATSDLVIRDDASSTECVSVATFAHAWDMPWIPTAEQYRHYIDDANFAIEGIQDISPNSTDRFRKWTRLYLTISDYFERSVERVLDFWDLDATTINNQIRCAHRALPYLRHLIVYARPQ